MIETLTKNKIFKTSLAIYFLLIFTFSRSFMGVYLFGFRIEMHDSFFYVDFNLFNIY